MNSSQTLLPSPLGDGPPQLAILDFFFPGFSMFSGVIQRYLHIDLNIYIPLILLLGGLAISWQYFTEYVWGQLEVHFMSTVDVRTDDETYNMLMSWVAQQRFSKGARRFIVNTNLNSRSWFLSWRDDEDEREDEADGKEATVGGKKKALAYTPTFGTHYFWYKGRLLIFNRNQNKEQSAFLVVSEREEIAISCFGRNPAILKELLQEARQQFIQRDEKKTVIYRGTTRSGSTDATWQRCLARSSRPFSTVILNEKVKQDLIDDVTDYLNPATRRWYSNRGIPYRRGYLLYGPPGTGKSSLSLALAGRFQLPVYMVSLSSITASEENLASLFAELPRRCVVLLEDIDTAGLTHTRDDTKGTAAPAPVVDDIVPGQVTAGGASGATNTPIGRLSLSGLLNILDGVASQEGRVLIMTTNHLEKLDKALIRPGRVDMIVKFDRADRGMVASLFRAIFAPIEGDNAPSEPAAVGTAAAASAALAIRAKAPSPAEVAAREKKEAEEERARDETIAKITALAETFADRIPAHEFSPAELQGYLLKNKRDPEGAVARSEEWVVESRKERQEKELREAEDKRKAEEAAKKEKEEKDKKAEKKKAKKEKKKAEAAKKKAKKQAKKKAKKDGAGDSDSSDSDSSSDSESDSEPEVEAKKKESAAPEAVEPSVVGEETKEVEAANAEAMEKAEKDDESLLKIQVVDDAKSGPDSGYGTPT